MLDENIILLAAKGEDVDQKRDYTCSFILQQIVQNCEYVVYCSTELVQRYQKKLNDLEKINRSAKFTATLIEHMQRSKKMEFKYYLAELPYEENVPRKDLFIIRLAALTNSTLITTDCRLKKQLLSKGLLEKYGIQIKHPKEF